MSALLEISAIGEQAMGAPSFSRKLQSALNKNLIGIRPSLAFKKLGPTRVYRVYVISDKFKSWRYAERQELIWRIVSANLSLAEQNQISMIVTATHAELEDDEDVPTEPEPETRRR